MLGFTNKYILYLVGIVTGALIVVTSIEKWRMFIYECYFYDRMYKRSIPGNSKELGSSE